jgi:hypothetical protein
MRYKLFLIPLIFSSCQSTGSSPEANIKPETVEVQTEIKDREKSVDSIIETVDGYQKPDTSEEPQSIPLESSESLEERDKNSLDSNSFESEIPSDKRVIDIISPEISPLSSEVSGVE